VRLRAIQGQIPPLGERPAGCIFIDRCPLAIEICNQRPDFFQVGESHWSRCHRWTEIEGQPDLARQPIRAEKVEIYTRFEEQVLEVKHLRVYFPVKRSLPQILRAEPPRQVKAVDQVDLEIQRGESLGLVGESGSGKTTLSRAVVGLTEKTAGEISLLGERLPASIGKRSLEVLSHLQMVFQNPEEALNPYMTVGEMLRRPYLSLMNLSESEAQEKVEQLLDAVQLSAAYMHRLPAELSGGEKQRVAIARAFATNPDLLIADEPVSSLDVSVQAAILNLINELQLEKKNSVLFISHDLAVVGFLADRIAVIYLGQLMEVARTADLFKPPYHPYTEALLSAIPLADPQAEQEQIRLEGELPKPTDEIVGCPFHTRCPRFLGDICVAQQPPWQVDDRGKRIYCHIPLEELRQKQTPVFSIKSPRAPDNHRREL
jgi:peptide/nickel transport system ATP-binding protein